MAPPDAYVRPRGAALPPREGRRGPPSPSRLVAAADEDANGEGEATE